MDMNQLVHRIITDLKFLYPCIAYEGESTVNNLIIITETKLSKVYPVKKIVEGMESLGEDYWGRYSFKDEHDQYYCEVDGELYFKGNDIDGEPHYSVKKIIHYEYPDVDSELIEFKPFVDQVKKYAEENNFQLVEHNPKVNLNSSNILESKIICEYQFIVNQKID